MSAMRALASGIVFVALLAGGGAQAQGTGDTQRRSASQPTTLPSRVQMVKVV